MSIADKLTALVSAKNDIKTALESKGVSPTGGLSTYADAIRSIESGSGGGTINKWIDGLKLAYSTVTEIPMFDTSEVTDMRHMFNHCYNLTSVPLFDTSKVTSMTDMFANCEKLINVPQFDTSNVTHMTWMFMNCFDLTTVPLLDATGVLGISGIFDGCGKLTNIGGFKNLGSHNILVDTTYSFRDCPNITRESVLNIFNNLYDRASAGYPVSQLYFERAVGEKLTYSDLAIATNKGWTIGFYS